MILSFEYLLDCGTGESPFAIHDKSNKLKVFFLDGDDHVRMREADPDHGQYDDLEFSEKGRVSPDTNISLPSIKRIIHFGAYGFWSANGNHAFVIYMMPTDISKSLIDGSVTFSIDSKVSSLSLKLANINKQLINQNYSLVSPGVKITLLFSFGDGVEVPLGVYYIDRTTISYPNNDLSVSGRNTIGKMLKEATVDETTEFDEGSLRDNILAIMELSEVEEYFVGDYAGDKILSFEQDKTLLDAIETAISGVSNWKIAETLDGIVGIGNSNDVRFDQPSIYSFNRDKTCFEYNIEYDDSDAAARVHVYSEQTDEATETVEIYQNVEFNRWWTQPEHRTLHVKTLNDTTLAQVTSIAQTLAASLAVSGRQETFVGLFCPYLVIGDEIHVIDENDLEETIGELTDLTHNFGMNGFYTSFTVDSGGRKGRTRLKDLISKAEKDPYSFIV